MAARVARSYDDTYCRSQELPELCEKRHLREIPLARISIHTQERAETTPRGHRRTWVGVMDGDELLCCHPGFGNKADRGRCKAWLPADADLPGHIGVHEDEAMRTTKKGAQGFWRRYEHPGGRRCSHWVNQNKDGRLSVSVECRH